MTTSRLENSLALTASIVLYNTHYDTLKKAVMSVLGCTLPLRLYLIDNSPEDTAGDWFSDNRIRYIFNNRNAGYGTAHNIAMRQCLDLSPYHLILNPDVSFSNNILFEICQYMDKNPDVGQLMPKVQNPDGTIQFLCKLLPTPYDLIIRRFLPFGGIKDRNNNRFELRFTGYSPIMNVPCLSGCFMFFRSSVLKEIGLFDESYFMYAEDFDLTRRIHRTHKTLYYPAVAIHHDWGKASYKKFRMTILHARSIIKYFNKWGWFFDEERRLTNKRVLNELNYSSHSRK